MDNIHKSLVILLLDFLKTVSFGMEKDSPGSYLSAFVPPDDLAGFASFIKVDEKGAGKHGNHKNLPYVTYGVRSLSVYISDLVEAMKLESIVRKALHISGPESCELGENFDKAFLLLEYIDSVLDVHKCNDEGVVKESAPLQRLD